MAKGKGNKSETRTPSEVKAEKEAAFKRVCQPRVNKAIKAIGLVGLCAADSYVFTKAQAQAVIDALQTSVDAVKARFEGDKQQAAGFKLPE